MKLELFNNNLKIKLACISISNHAFERIKEKCPLIGEYNVIKWIYKQTLKAKDIIEYYEDNGEVIRAVYKIPYNMRLNMALVVDKDYHIVTLYFNNKYDNHATLNKDLYEKK
jgi:hypothetical protein